MKRVVPAPNGAPPAQAGNSAQQLSNPGFAETIIQWQKRYGRHTLPWQNTRDAYRIWLSEIMLQQTQVSAVIPYYQRFLQRFPDVATLAAAPVEEVMAHWSGLGYYTRARNLHRCAQRVASEYGGVFPADPVLLADLPGIGRSTAAAIAAFSHGVRAAILDGNVKRVFARVFGIDGYPGEKRVESALWLRAEALLPQQDMTAYTQGLMDLGATVCTRSQPACPTCPLASRCIAFNTLRTHELPVRKPRKTVPEKHVAMLIVVHDNQVLLERRPDQGIWGGLLSLPEIDRYAVLGQASQNLPALPQDALLQAVAPFGVPASHQRLPNLMHGFTHFKLHITPYRVDLQHRPQLAGESRYLWLAGDSIAQAPLPAPIKKLLLGLHPALQG